MAYEVFQRKVVRVEDPAISVTADGRITLNAAATRTLAQAGVKSVLLLWDKGNRKVAIKAVPSGEENAFKVSYSRNKQASSLRAKLFLAYVGWSWSKRQRLRATWDPKAKMLEAILPSDSRDKTRPLAAPASDIKAGWTR